ncbi:MAG: SCO family protein [Pseudomonadota bacterium]|nr:SCO family protein [Pseudomonadota bacterium]
MPLDSFALAVIVTVFFAAAFGRLRAGAARRSHQWFGCTAAPASRERWRMAVYAGLAGSAMLLAGPPAHAGADGGYQRVEINGTAPKFTLADQDGKRVSLADFRGKVVIAIFMYTQCKDICPTMPQILTRVDNWLSPEEKAKVRFVGISIDPRRDTPERLREFMKGHNLDPSRWTLLTGSLPEIAKVVTDYGVVVRPDVQGDLVHNAVYVVIDPKGVIRSEFHGLFSPTQEIVKDVRSLLVVPSVNKR